MSKQLNRIPYVRNCLSSLHGESCTPNASHMTISTTNTYHLNTPFTSSLNNSIKNVQLMNKMISHPRRYNSTYQKSSSNHHEKAESASKSKKMYKVRRDFTSEDNKSLPRHKKYNFPKNPKFRPKKVEDDVEEEVDVDELEFNMNSQLSESLQRDIIQLNKELSKLENYSVVNVHDMVTQNYDKLKKMALQDRRDGKASHMPEVQIVENIGGYFHSLGSEGVEGTVGNSISSKSQGWKLPEVEGVKSQLHLSSDPVIRNESFDSAAKQQLLEVQNRLLLSGEVSEVTDETTKALMIQQELALSVLKENTPVSNPFLPPHTYVSPPLNIADGDTDMSKDTVASVLVPAQVLKHMSETMNKRNLAISRKLGLKEKETKHLTIPSTVEMTHSYNALLDKGHDLLHKAIKASGFGHIAHYSDMNDLLSNTNDSDEVTDIAEHIKSLPDTIWKDRVVLPLVSHDGYSEDHLPTSVKQSLGILRKAFDSLCASAEPTPTSFTLMMNVYSELGMPARAAEVFDKLRASDTTVPDTTSYNVMLNILADNNKINTACKLYEEMRDLAVSFGHGTGPTPPPQHAAARKAKVLRDIAVRKARAQGLKNLEFDEEGLSELLNDEYDSLVIPPAREDLIPRPDVVTYCTVIKALGKIGDKHGALHVFNQMRRDHVKLNEVAWGTTINVMCQTGDFKAGLRLLHEMRESGSKPSKVTYRAMINSAGREGQVTLAVALIHQMHNEGVPIDTTIFSNLIRSLAEAGSVVEAIKLHQQLTKGRFGPSIQPNRATYNALLETLADPQSWGRLTLSDHALQVGLSVYQEALLLNIYPHPYSERAENGILDLRPYSRGSVLFPIHLFLNLMINHIPIDLKGMQDNIKNAEKILLKRYQLQNQENQAPSLFDPVLNLQREKDSVPMYFPRIQIPKKGVMMVGSKELKKVWTSAPKFKVFNSGRTKLKAKGDPAFEKEKFITMRECIENVLKSTRPWIHYQTVKTNANVVIVPASNLRFWVSEQRRRIGLDSDHPNYNAQAVLEKQQRKLLQQQAAMYGDSIPSASDVVSPFQLVGPRDVANEGKNDLNKNLSTLDILKKNASPPKSLVHDSEPRNETQTSKNTISDISLSLINKARSVRAQKLSTEENRQIPVDTPEYVMSFMSGNGQPQETSDKKNIKNKAQNKAQAFASLKALANKLKKKT